MSNPIRNDFPALKQNVHGKSLIYLDSAATTLKPQVVIDRLNKYHQLETSNVHRGAHYLSDIGTQAFESARQTSAKFINADSVNEIVFTYGTTDGINLLASSLIDTVNFKGKNIVVTEMEHHSNLVPWHLLAKKTGANIKVIPVTDQGDLDMTAAESIIDKNTVLISFVHISNTLGSVNDAKKLCAMAKAVGAYSLVDAAQSISCKKIDVQDIGCDFLVFSGHKLFGPYGIGILFGKEELLNKFPPYRGGGAMIENVEFLSSTYLPAPQRFEAGTPNIPAVIGLATAMDYVTSIGFDKIQKLESELLSQARNKFKDIPGIEIFGNPKDSVNILPFTARWGHAADIGQILDQQGVAIRVGHHCTQPLLKKFNLTSVARASFSIYSDLDDVDRLYNGLLKCKEMLT